VPALRKRAAVDSFQALGVAGSRDVRSFEPSVSIITLSQCGCGARSILNNQYDRYEK